MRGKGGDAGWMPPLSIQDILSDRRLKKFMDFNKMIEQVGGGGAGGGGGWTCRTLMRSSCAERNEMV